MFNNFLVTEQNKIELLSIIHTIDRLLQSGEISPIEREFYMETKNRLHIVSITSPWNE